MSREADRLRELVEAFDGSTSLQVEAIMGLFNRENVEELVAAMPADFRPDFVDWCTRLRQGGPPLPGWDPEFARGFEAVRAWLEVSTGP